jgi:hypothetical protein
MLFAVTIQAFDLDGKKVSANECLGVIGNNRMWTTCRMRASMGQTSARVACWRIVALRLPFFWLSSCIVADVQRWRRSLRGRVCCNVVVLFQ